MENAWIKVAGGALSLPPLAVGFRRLYQEGHEGLDASGFETEAWFGGGIAILLATGLAILFLRSQQSKQTGGSV